MSASYDLSFIICAQINSVLRNKCTLGFLDTSGRTSLCQYMKGARRKGCHLQPFVECVAWLIFVEI